MEVFVAVGYVEDGFRRILRERRWMEMGTVLNFKGKVYAPQDRSTNSNVGYLLKLFSIIYIV